MVSLELLAMFMVFISGVVFVVMDLFKTGCQNMIIIISMFKQIVELSKFVEVFHWSLQNFI